MKFQKIEFKKIKNEKAITLMSLIITIAVMLIIVSTTSYVGYKRYEINKLNKLEKDLTLLQDKVINYYSKYNGLPILKDDINENIIYPYTLNFNTDTEDNGNYYILDLEAMENLNLNYGKDLKKYKSKENTEEDKDLYIINETSQIIYYVKGITVDDKTYHYIANKKTSESEVPPTNPKIKIVDGEKIKENDTIPSFVEEVLLEFIPGKDNTVGVNRTTYLLQKDGTTFLEETDISTLENNMCKLNTSGAYEIQVKTYNNNNISSTNTIKLNLYKVITDLKIGDYINYDPTKTDANRTQNVEEELLKYTSYVGTGLEHGNGSSEQTFTATSKYAWRILDIDSDTGKITLISEKGVQTDAGTDFALKGTIGYLYAEQEIQEICKTYGYGYGADRTLITNYEIGGPQDRIITKTITGSGARSITIEDCNKLAGITENDFVNLSQGITSLQYGDASQPEHDIYYPTITTSTGKSEERSNTKLKFTAYVWSSDKISNSKLIQMLFNGERYWLASRAITTNVGSWACFGVRRNYISKFDTACLFESGISSITEDGLESNIENKCRPIVKLRLDMQMLSLNDEQNGSTSEKAYDLR